MEQDLTVLELEVWQSVSCNSCARHNFQESRVNKERYTDSKMFELKARSQTTVLCKDCLNLLKDTLTTTLGGEI